MGTETTLNGKLGTLKLNAEKEPEGQFGLEGTNIIALGVNLSYSM